MKPNISSIAKKANVSKSTVSRVINGGYASEEVRQRVEEVIHQMNYAPSQTARNLALGRSGAFGLVLENIGVGWQIEVLRGIEEACVAEHLSMIMGSLFLKAHFDDQVVRSWIAHRTVDGLIFLQHGPQENSIVQAAKEAGLPMAFMGQPRNPDDGWSLTCDNMQGARLAAEHLLGLGHRRLHYLGGPEGAKDSQERLIGVRQAVERSGLQGAALTHSWGDFKRNAGWAFAEEWLAMPRAKAPTGLICGNDAMALGFMRVVRSKGVQIPLDVSVTGFDDIQLSALVDPALTTVRQDMRAMGIKAVECVVKALGGQDLKPETIIFPVELIVRESSGAAPKN